jgi:hypothetical protein
MQPPNFCFGCRERWFVCFWVFVPVLVFFPPAFLLFCLGRFDKHGVCGSPASKKDVLRNENGELQYRRFSFSGPVCAYVSYGQHLKNARDTFVSLSVAVHPSGSTNSSD